MIGAAPWRRSARRGLLTHERRALRPSEKGRPMLTQTKTPRPAPTRAPRAAKASRRRVVDLHGWAWFDLFHGQDLTWPAGETTVEAIARAIRATA
jgi:hypothetical protein